MLTPTFQRIFSPKKNIDGFFDDIRDQFIKEADGKLASETPISLDGVAGREVKVHIYRGDLRLRMFLDGDRAYILSFLSLEKSDEEAAKKFFASFKLNRVSRPIAAGKARVTHLKKLAAIRFKSSIELPS